MVGIDPGSGASSPTGFSAFYSDTLELLYAANITTNKRELRHRIKQISDTLEGTIKDIQESNPDHRIVCFVEQFVMRGKGGETLQRLIGSFMGRIPYNIELFHVQNTTVKAVLAGHGHADKVAVGRAVETFFLTNPASSGLIRSLTNAGEADIIDSIAIGVAGWLNESKKFQTKKS